MEFLPQEIQIYAENHSQNASDILNKIERDTNLHVLLPRMISGHLQGRMLSMLSHMISPKKILEIGTYTGYSALCLLEGIQAGGKLVTIDVNEELESRVRGYFKQAGVEDTIEYRIGNAIDILPQLDGFFDLVFIDADKSNYSNYFDLIIDKIRKGGYIIADNVLWSGKVVSKNLKIDSDTHALTEFNAKVHTDSRVENVLFPVRDGLMIMRKL